MHDLPGLAQVVKPVKVCESLLLPLWKESRDPRPARQRMVFAHADERTSRRLRRASYVGVLSLYRPLWIWNEVGVWGSRSRLRR